MQKQTFFLFKLQLKASEKFEALCMKDFLLIKCVHRRQQTFNINIFKHQFLHFLICILKLQIFSVVAVEL